jgi:hypothetical protein
MVRLWSWLAAAYWLGAGGMKQPDWNRGLGCRLIEIYIIPAIKPLKSNDGNFSSACRLSEILQ